MALVDCSECNKKISSEAQNCPHCGALVNLEKIKEKQKSGAKGCFIFFIVTLIIAAFANMCNNSETTPTKSVYTEPKTDTIAEQKKLDSINKAYEISEAKFKKTKAGKIQSKHSDWTKEECELVAKKRIWIGMKYEMLTYFRGKPNTINTSNYGNGNEYQCCWDDYTPSCFYMKEDHIITSYN